MSLELLKNIDFKKIDAMIEEDQEEQSYLDLERECIVNENEIEREEIIYTDIEKVIDNYIFKRVYSVKHKLDNAFTFSPIIGNVKAEIIKPDKTGKTKSKKKKYVLRDIIEYNCNLYALCEDFTIKFD